jgi:hypothetical protein
MKQQKELSDILIKDLEDYKVTRAASINKHRINVQNSMKDIAIAQEALDRAKKNYNKAKNDLHDANDKLSALEIIVATNAEEKTKEVQGRESSRFSMGRMLSAFEVTPEQERDKLQKKRVRKYSELISCITQIAEKKNNLMDKINILDNAMQKVFSYLFFISHLFFSLYIYCTYFISYLLTFFFNQFRQ